MNIPHITAMSELVLSGKRVLIRADLNVPLSDGKVTSDTRIQASVPTIEAALSQGASVVVMSHLGRPKEGSFDASASLAPVAQRLGELLDTSVALLPELDDCKNVQTGQVALLENVRFLTGEKADDETLARRMAEICDVFVWMPLVPRIVHKPRLTAWQSMRQASAQDCYSKPSCVPFNKPWPSRRHPWSPSLAVPRYQPS